MTKRVNRITIILFSTLVLGLSLAFWILPDRSFSEKENRFLTQRPSLSLAGLSSGDFMDETEDYLADQFPARDQWCVLQSAANKAIGRKDNNGVYLRGDHLIQTFWTLDEKQLNKNILALKSYAAKVKQSGGTVTFVPIPNAVEVEKDRLPLLAPDVSEESLIRQMKTELATENCNVVNTLENLKKIYSEVDTPLYYRTDHHMTTYGAFQVYESIAPALGYTPLKQDAFHRSIVSSDFTGTLYNKSAAWWVEPDVIEQWTPISGTGATQIELTIPALNLKTDHLYNEDALDTASKYDYFCYGNQPLEVIQTNGTGGRLLVLKDSYAHNLIPFLANHYSEIHMIDLRYYHGSIQKYATEHELTSTLILYNVSNFCEDTSFVSILT